MGIKKFINNVRESLGLDDSKKKSKKKSLKNLLKKLTEKKVNTDKLLKTKLDKKKRKELEEELQIIVYQIKHGKKILQKLISNE